MILAAIHPVPPVGDLGAVPPEEKYHVLASQAEWAKWIYRVREWTVTVTASETYPEGGGDPTAISDNYIARAYQDNYIDGVPGLGDPQDDSRQTEVFESIPPYSGGGAVDSVYSYRSFIGTGTTGSLIMSRSTWGTDDGDYKIFLALNYSIYITAVDEDIYDNGQFTLRTGVATMEMGSKTWPISVLVKDVPNEISPWWADVSVEIKATKFWTYAEGYPGAIFNATTGVLVSSPFEP